MKQSREHGTGQESGGMLFSNQDLRRLIFPLIIEQILAVSVGMADTMMVSSVGDAATSGVSLVDMINNLFINVFAAVATGGAVVSAQFLGQKRRDQACRAANQLILITGIVAAAIMILCITLREGLLHVIYRGVAEDVMRNAVIYLVLSAASYPFLAVYNSCAALFRSMGNSKISMDVSIVMNVVNVAGNAVFIFWMGWGVAGAAIASLISRMIACGILMYLLRDEKLDIHLIGDWKWNGRMMKQILHIGIPNGIENSIFQLGRVLVVGIIALFGTTQIAANAIANNLDSMGVLPGVAMNLAIISVIGRCVGAGNFGQAEYYAKKLIKLTYVINGVCCGLVIVTMPLTLRLYGVSEDALRLGAILAVIHCGCGILIWPVSFCLANVLRAANDVKFPMCVSILSMIIFRIGFSYVLAIGLSWGAIGVWWAMVADWIVRAGFFVWRFVNGRWKTFYRTA